MLEQYLGEETFRSGISRYLEEHSYGNTETDDLWAALESESGEPVGDIMSGWIYQGGYPQIDVTIAEGGFRLNQRQFRFSGDGDSQWQVPLLYRLGPVDSKAVVAEEGHVAGDESSLLLNRGGHGFYRINYPADHLEMLAAGFSDLEPAERYTLLADVWANVRAGETPAGEFISLVGALDGETEPDVWGVAIGGLAELARVISPDDRGELQQLVRDLVGKHVAELGWAPEEGETDLQRKLRGLLLRTIGNLGDDTATQRTARDVFDQAVSTPGSVDTDVADAATSIVAANGGKAEFERFLELRSVAKSPQDEERYLRSAAAVPEEDTAAQLIEMILAGDIRSHDANWLVARLLGHRDTGASVWELVKEDWDDLLGAMPPQNRRRMLDLIQYRSEPEVASDIEAWFETHELGGAERFTAQQMERLRIRVGLREREGERLGDVLRAV
jgi:puromycin-sensitive aminopeptidase